MTVGKYAKWKNDTLLLSKDFWRSEVQHSLGYYSDTVDKAVQGSFALCDRSDFWTKKGANSVEGWMPQSCTLKLDRYSGFHSGNGVPTLKPQNHRSGCCVKSLVNRALQSLLQREWIHTIKCHFRKSTLLLSASLRLAFDLTWKQGM